MGLLEVESLALKMKNVAMMAIAMTMASRIAVMNAGLLQQIDTPQNLYDRPGNKFVAGFIGSPAMNFFDGKLEKADGKLVFDAGSFKVDIPGNKTSVYDSYAGKSVTFGIRPEDVHDPAYIPANITPSKISAKVDVTELMGNEINAFFNNGDHSFVGRIDPRSGFKFGDDVEVVLNMGNFHIFDKETEEAVR